MTVSEFIQHVREGLDAGLVRGARGADIVARFVAPSSGFCGPDIRPKYLGESEDGLGRYGLSRRQAEKVLTLFDVTLPPKDFGG